MTMDTLHVILGAGVVAICLVFLFATRGGHQ